MATIVVTVAWATPSVQELVDVEVPAHARARDAIERSGIVSAYGLDLDALGVSIFGRRAALDSAISDGDRIELTRGLAVDAKDARRKRVLERSAPPGKRRAR